LSKKTKSKTKIRSEPQANNLLVQWLSKDEFADMCKTGYIPLSDHPDVKVCVKNIADLISSMTIMLMENKELGNVRVKNELSRKVDIDPNPYITRKTLYQKTVEELLFTGNSFLLPRYSDGLLRSLEPVYATDVTLSAKEDFGYKVKINNVPFSHEEVIHFVNNPKLSKPWEGQSYKVYLKDVMRNLRQSQDIKSDYYTNNYKPNLVFSFNADSGSFDGEEEREKLHDKWIKTKAGEPYILPAALIDFKSFSPMSLSDIAINESVEIDKRFIASLFGVPPFMLGIGKYNKDEYNNFVNTTIYPICVGMAQELTRKLILSPSWFLKFNLESIKAFDLEARLKIMYEGRKIAIYNANECRIAAGDEPVDLPEMNEYVMLENYIRAEDTANQKKLLQGGDE